MVPPAWASMKAHTSKKLLTLCGLCVETYWPWQERMLRFLVGLLSRLWLLSHPRLTLRRLRWTRSHVFQ